MLGAAVGDWRTFQVLKPGVALPFLDLWKLSWLYGESVRLNVSDCHQNTSGIVSMLCFNRYQVSDLIFGNLKKSLLRKIEAQEGLDFFYGRSKKLNRGGGAGTAEHRENLEKISGKESADELIDPHVMLIMAIVCQMKVNKYSEHVVKRGEIPRALHLVVDGEATVTFEETILKDAESSEHCRGKGTFGNEPIAPIGFMHRRKTLGQHGRAKTQVVDPTTENPPEVVQQDPFPITQKQPVKE